MLYVWRRVCQSSATSEPRNKLALKIVHRLLYVLRICLLFLLLVLLGPAFRRSTLPVHRYDTRLPPPPMPRFDAVCPPSSLLFPAAGVTRHHDQRLPTQGTCRPLGGRSLQPAERPAHADPQAQEDPSAGGVLEGHHGPLCQLRGGRTDAEVVMCLYSTLSRVSRGVNDRF